MTPAKHQILSAHPGDGVRVPQVRTGGNRRPEKKNPYEAGATLIEYWRLLSANKLFLFLAAAVGLLIGIGVTIPMKPVYRARTSIEILNLNEDFMNMKQSAPVTTSDGSSDRSDTQNQIKLLESTSLAKRVLKKLAPPENQVAANVPAPPSPSWKRWLGMDSGRPTNPQKAVLSATASTLKVRASPHTRILEATVDSTNPQVAAAFLTTLIEEFIQKNLEDRIATTHHTGDWLGKEIKDARDHLKESENALQSYARASGIIFTDGDINVATEKLQQLQLQLSTAVADRISKEARYNLAKSSPPDTMIDVLNDTGLKEIRGRINELRRQIADLGVVYTPGYTKLKRSEAELGVLQQAFDKTRADIIRRIENDYQEALTREKLLAKAYDTQTGEVTGQDEKTIQYNILKREVDSNSQLYNTILQQTRQSSIASALRANNVRVIDPAEVPESPISPNKKVNAIIGCILGLMACVAVILVRERTNATFKQPGETRMITNLVELGTIPRVAESNRFMYPLWNKADSNGTKAIGKPPRRLRSNGVHSPELVTWQQKPSIVAESVRSALTSIFLVGEFGNDPTVLAFTSGHALEGKTTTVSNMAIAAAEIGRNVLVIDADLRRPRMHDIFGLPNECGLGDLLSGQIGEEALSSLIHETSIPGLSVLPAGPATDAAVYLLYSHALHLLLERLRTMYDLILIDTPPMLQVTDARIVGRQADAMVLVVRSGKTSLDALVAARDRLDEDSIRVLGTILNDWDPSTSRAGYPGYYGSNAQNAEQVGKGDQSGIL